MTASNEWEIINVMIQYGLVRLNEDARTLEPMKDENGISCYTDPVTKEVLNETKVASLHGFPSPSPFKTLRKKLSIEIKRGGDRFDSTKSREAALEKQVEEVRNNLAQLIEMLNSRLTGVIDRAFNKDGNLIDWASQVKRAKRVNDVPKELTK